MSPIRAIDLELWDLFDTFVETEWQRVDILLINRTYSFAVIIENKIDTEEHSKQLQRYYDAVEQSYPNFKIIPLLLSPDGVTP